MRWRSAAFMNHGGCDEEDCLYGWDDYRFGFHSVALGQAQTQLADFKITVEATTGAAKLECLRGCAWKTLSFGCEGKAECKAQVDQTGVSGIKTP